MRSCGRATRRRWRVAAAIMGFSGVVLYSFGEFPAHARALQADLTAILNIARHHYPNLRVAYLSSRTFGGWSGRASGSPEPYAYESGFGTRWVVQSQIRGDAQLNCDPARGEVKAPLVLWGPYLWARGNLPRKLDGLVWTESDGQCPMESVIIHLAY